MREIQKEMQRERKRKISRERQAYRVTGRRTRRNRDTRSKEGNIFRKTKIRKLN